MRVLNLNRKAKENSAEPQMGFAGIGHEDRRRRMMKPFEIASKVHWVGAIDWNIRDFHGYSTYQGTTYNAYLIQDEKTY
jgi:hypothetical protein